VPEAAAHTRPNVASLEQCQERSPGTRTAPRHTLVLGSPSTAHEGLRSRFFERVLKPADAVRGEDGPSPGEIRSPARHRVDHQDAGYWLAADDAATFDAVATVQVTDCWASLFGGTNSCLANDRGDGIVGQSGAEGQTWLDVAQLYADGSVCQVNQAYSEEGTGGQVQLSESYDISDAQHHLPLYYDVSAPVSQLCGGSRRFAVDVYIGWTASNPVKLDGGNVNVINSGYARTTVVPDVTGRAQAQAGDAIEANGLTTSFPDYVASPAPSR